MLSTTPYLLQRNRHYSFRRAIPKHLAVTIGREELKIALGTADFSLARRRARTLANRFEEAMDMVAKSKKLDTAQIDALIRRHVTAEWAILQEDARNPDLEPEVESDQAQEGVEELTRQIRDNRHSGVTLWAAQKALGAHLPADTPEATYGAHVMLRAQAELLRLRAHAFRGEYVLPADPLFADLRPVTASPAVEEKPKGITISKALRGWSMAEKRSVKTFEAWHHAVNLFIKLNGDLPVTEITPEHVRAFRDMLRQYPRFPGKRYGHLSLKQMIRKVARDKSVPKITAATVAKHMNALKSILSWCCEEGHLQHSPAAGVKVRGSSKPSKPRVPYSLEDLAALFAGPVHSAAARPTAGGAEAAFWLPVLALYSGARLNELGQLMASDVREETGTVFLDFNSEGDKHLKTHSSQRRVPVHPELVHLGLMKYVEQRRKAGPDARLFPALRPSAQKVLTSRFSLWWNRYAKTLIAPTPGASKTFHSFRHLYKDRLRECGAPEDIRDALAGHSHPSVGRGYGSGHSLKSLAEWVSKIEFPGVEIALWKPAGGKATAKSLAEQLGLGDMTAEEVAHLKGKMKDPVGLTMEAGK